MEEDLLRAMEMVSTLRAATLDCKVIPNPGELKSQRLLLTAQHPHPSLRVQAGPPSPHGPQLPKAVQLKEQLRLTAPAFKLCSVTEKNQFARRSIILPCFC